MNELIEEYGLRKIDVANKMFLSPAAITQYTKGGRGSSFVKELSVNSEIRKNISEISKFIAGDGCSVDVIIEKMCEICKSLRMEGIICELHNEEYSDKLLSDCELCKKGE
jgi:predicted transcriptional regulator